MCELSTRARITATRFVNEYHWGNFKGDPGRMVERYYDAHLYVTNWGTHRFLFKLPQATLDPDVIDQYCLGDHLTAIHMLRRRQCPRQGSMQMETVLTSIFLLAGWWLKPNSP